MSVVTGIVGRNLRLFFRDRLNVFFFRTFKHETDFGGPAAAPEAERAAR